MRSQSCILKAASSGDLLTALLLARLDQAQDDLKTAVELALASLQHIVQKTYDFSISHIGADKPLPEVRLSRCLHQIACMSLGRSYSGKHALLWQFVH